MEKALQAGAGPQRGEWEAREAETSPCKHPGDRGARPGPVGAAEKWPPWKADPTGFLGLEVGRGQEEVRDNALGVGQGTKRRGAAGLHQTGAHVWGPPGAHF